MTNSKNIEFWMVRHGETIFNTKGIVQGWCDSPLTENGVLMSGCLGKGLSDSRINFESVYSSDLTRCLETARLISKFLNNKLKIKPNKNLREINTGDREGDLISEYLKEYPFSLNFKKHTGTPHGETWQDVYDRLIPELYKIYNKQPNRSKVLIVTHSMLIASIIGYLDQSVEEVIYVPNNSVTIFSFIDGKLSLKSLPDQKYIEYGIKYKDEIKHELNLF
ncbi:histidine phosphatase family protein [Streptococcus troglodytae]|uniref:Phosphoglycerate mutase n=1 Tax=Streptococcus troglodytae TaxID=1111760 RepID=A0A1L7LLU3_9STRE|nr:histidine phosphatase family protein [Streptococcus troglodytae]BAQ25088.1 putative uncharacterized protein [Streptococcus troglodytae]